MSEDKGLTPRGYINRFRTLMKLRCNAVELNKFIEYHSLAPGVSFGGWHDRMRGWRAGCSKSDIIEELVAGSAFVPGSEEKIVQHFGFRE